MEDLAENERIEDQSKKQWNNTTKAPDHHAVRFSAFLFFLLRTYTLKSVYALSLSHTLEKLNTTWARFSS